MTPSVRLNHKRNALDVDDAVNQLKLHKPPIKVVVIVVTCQAAAKFIEKTHDLLPGLIFTKVVGGTELAEKLMLLGSRFANGVIVTQVVPAADGYSTVVLGYKNSLAKYFPGEAPDYVALGGCVTANVLIQAMKRVDQQLDTEADRQFGRPSQFGNLPGLDLGLATTLNFGPLRAPGFARDLGTALDEAVGSNGRTGTASYQPYASQPSPPLLARPHRTAREIEAPASLRRTRNIRLRIIHGASGKDNPRKPSAK